MINFFACWLMIKGNNFYMKSAGPLSFDEWELAGLITTTLAGVLFILGRKRA